MKHTPATIDKPSLPPSLTRIILIGLIGNVVEWYDFAIFGYFASVIGNQFFPSSSPSTSLIASFGAFAAGFLMRPIGGLVFGQIGDSLGRHQAMMISVLAMAIPTVLMCAIPTYATIGVAAPIFLVILRMIQGLSVGGEYTSSLIFLAENAPPGRKSLTAIWGSWGATSGILLGSAIGWLLTHFMPEPDINAWGWRIPFGIGGVIALSAWLIRRGLDHDLPETQTESPVREVLRRHHWPVVRVALLNIGTAVAYYTAFVYAVTYIRNIDQVPESLALELNSVSMAFLLMVLPVAAWLADRWGSHKVLKWALSLLCVFAVPLFQLIHSPDPERIFMGEIGFALLIGMGSGGILILNTSLIPKSVRCTGLAFAYNASTGLFGGTTPLIAAWLVSSTDNPISPAYWVLGAAFVSLATLTLFIPNMLHLETEHQ